MIKDDFFKANELITKIRNLDHQLTDLYNSMLKINALSDKYEGDYHGLKISRNQLQVIHKYNKEVLENRKSELEKQFKSI